MKQAEIQAVPRRFRTSAAKFLAGGNACAPAQDAQKRAILTMIANPPGAKPKFWWARSGRTILAAAMVVENPGRTGMLLTSPPYAPGVERQQLVELVRQISKDSITDGLSLVQALIDPTDTAQAALLKDSGMIMLAELIYMRRDLLKKPPAPTSDRNDIAWRDYNQFTETQLGEIIAQTYVDSLDCPALRGVRDMNDIIAGHKSAGVFRPESWWIADCDQPATPAGCILVNDSPVAPSADIIYMGVAREFRGRRLARAMLDRTIELAQRRGKQLVSVAVDTRNEHAIRVYQQSGFVELRRRIAYVELRKNRS
ncbi:MAG: GNAT family N-acetyltransferase [Phycisphaerales bacterium]|jgi:mycothiol synthase|nr:GNAT family N-acetyltransferase [Phycisphaerales bacterium]